MDLSTPSCKPCTTPTIYPTNSFSSDIEQEVNGLYSYDRREKVPAARVKALMDAAAQYYYKNVAPAS